MPCKTYRLCTPESSKNLIFRSIFHSITFTLARVIVRLFKYYAYFSCNYQFSASPYVIAIVNLRNCVRPIVVFSKCKKILFRPWKSVVVFGVAAFNLVSMIFLYFCAVIFRFVVQLSFFSKCFSICVYLNSVFSFVKICFSSRVNRKVMIEFDLYLEFNKNSIKLSLCLRKG